MTAVIPDGSSFSTEKVFTGQVRELRVDTSNKRIRLHDGVTPGGVQFFNLDDNDSRYQKHSDELDGLIKFKPEDKGAVVRRGPANYVIRKIVGQIGGITVTNGDFQEGDVEVTLPQVLTGDREIDGDFSVTGNAGVQGSLQVGDGVIADLTGDVTGNLTGDSSGTHTGDTIGGLDARGKTVQLDDAALAISKISGLTAALNAATPKIGMIMMWAGDLSAVPAGWHLCDGTNGTPNLADKFIMGAKDAAGANPATQNTTGGASTHNHGGSIQQAGTHSHGITVQDHTLTTAELPSHNHGSGISMFGAQPAVQGTQPGAAAGGGNMDYHTNASGSVQSNSTSTGGGGAHSHGGSSDDAGNHTHGLTINETSNIPPYYALAFIMKVS